MKEKIGPPNVGMRKVSSPVTNRYATAMMPTIAAPTPAPARATVRHAKRAPDRQDRSVVTGTSSGVAVTGTLRHGGPTLYRYGVPSPSRPATRLEIRLLGPPEVLVDGSPMLVDTRKAIAILAILAADRRPYSRDELAALLWPESDEDGARGALRRTLSALRGAVGDGPLRIDRGTVALVEERCWIDLAVIDAAARSDDRPGLAAAAGLARGTFLAGFSLRDSPEFDDWRAARSVSAERAVLMVLDRLAAAAEADGDVDAAIDAASHRLDLDPLDEAGHVRLMDLLAVSGARGAALRQYRQCVAILDRELGVAPLAATTARYEAIRDVDGAAAGVVPPGMAPLADPHVPRPSIAARDLPLVGREAALAGLRAGYDSVAAAGGHALAIVGEAGIGKTRLAATFVATVRSAGGAVLSATGHPAEQAIAYGAIAELLRSATSLPDGERRLAALDPSTRAGLARLLPSLDPRPTPGASDGPGAHARLVRDIADGLVGLASGVVPGVLWLDDVQWLDGPSLEALGYIERRLSGSGIVLLVAWRPEDLDGAARGFADRVTAVSSTIVVPLERLTPADVVRLAVSSGVSVDEAAVDRLVIASEGLPLYVAEVLAQDVAAGDVMPKGVEAVLRQRLGTVAETTGQILATAAVIGRSFDLQTVRHASGRSDDEAVDALEEGVRRGLIREGPTGFDFAHGALRDLAMAGTTLTRRRLLHRRVADALRIDLAGHGRADLGRLVRIAAHERAAGRDEAAAEAYAIASERAEEVFANREAIDYGEMALALGHPDATRLHGSLGRLRTRLGDYAGAIASLEAAAALAQPSELSALEWSLARAHLRRGDLAAADHHLAAASVGVPAPDDRLLARIAVDRAVVRRRARDPEGAALAAAEAQAFAIHADDRLAIGAAHRMRGLAALDADDTQLAVTELIEAANVALDDPDPTATIAALAGLAMATAAHGDVDAALVHGEAALTVCRRIGDRHLEAAVEDHLADLLHHAGREEDAMQHLQRAVAAFAEVGGDPADPDPGIWMLSAS